MQHILHIMKKVLHTLQLIVMYININRRSWLKTIHQHKRTISRRCVLGAFIVMKTYILAYKGSNSQPLSIYVKPLNIMITYMIHSYNKYIIHY